jgi:hypothetical protein
MAGKPESCALKNMFFINRLSGVTSWARASNGISRKRTTGIIKAREDAASWQIRLSGM